MNTQTNTPDNKIISMNSSVLDSYLESCGPETFSVRLQAFIKQQLATWPDLKRAINSLDEQLIKNIFLTDSEVILQHNPRRLKSSASKVDKKSIDQRPCFLCPENLYKEQLGLSWNENWLILNNPYPIFKDHLVISHKKHIFQNVNDALPAMIKFVHSTDFLFSAFYNGPACGASAPDHLHFQACKKKDLPIISQIDSVINSGDFSNLSVINKNSSSSSFAATFDNRGIFICLSESRDVLFSIVDQAISFLKNMTADSEEPLINIIISGSDRTYTAILFPRKTHRPEYFYKSDNEKLLISPGAVDVGGVVILPREEDYLRTNKKYLLEIFSEVCLDHSVFQDLIF